MAMFDASRFSPVQQQRMRAERLGPPYWPHYPNLPREVIPEWRDTPTELRLFFVNWLVDRGRLTEWPKETSDEPAIA